MEAKTDPKVLIDLSMEQFAVLQSKIIGIILSSRMILGVMIVIPNRHPFLLTILGETDQHVNK